MVMTKTFWVSAILAMLVVMASYSSNNHFYPVSDLSNTALEVSGLNMQFGDAGYFAVSMLTQYLILLAVFYFFLRSVAKSFKN